ncbi:MAG: hypothetical protein VYC34_08805, partial [Planctomycetota bacterium]|nr:hypothetical protein [Planctomycetota bacterium]
MSLHHRSDTELKPHANGAAHDHADTRPTVRLRAPLRGAGNPGSTRVTTPGSFANAPDLGGALMFSSPDTPGMPAPSMKTAWDFLPDGWRVESLPDRTTQNGSASRGDNGSYE